MTEEKQPTDWRKFGRVSTAMLVGSFAAYASYDHMRSLALAHGQAHSIASVLPISVDGLIVFGTWNMDARNRFWPRLCAWLGALATICANVLAAPPDLLSQVISAWAPVSLLCVIETWSRRDKTDAWSFRRDVAADVAAEPAEPPETAPAAVVESPKPRTRNRRGLSTEKKLAAAWKRNPDATAAELGFKAGVSESTARRFIDAQVAALTKVSAGVMPAAE